MPRKSHAALLDRVEGLDLSLSGIAILGLVAGLHMTSASIDLIEAAQATTLGPENLIQVTDVVIGTALALVPLMRGRRPNLQRAFASARR